MKNVQPEMVAISPQTDKDRGRYSRPEQFQAVVAVAVGGLSSSPGSILNKKIDEDNLCQHEYPTRQIINKVGELIDQDALLAGNLRHPPQVRRADSGARANAGCNKQ